LIPGPAGDDYLAVVHQHPEGQHDPDEAEDGEHAQNDGSDEGAATPSDRKKIIKLLINY
jgi:hypothetical protein